jgi:uroporphyrinogen III methyltransferase/synthase
VAREALAQLLVEGGAAEVVVAPAYKTIAPKGNIPGDVPYDLVAFSSSSTATNFFELMGNPALATKVAAIGPITASTARQLGFDVVVEPRDYTIPALVAAIRDYFASQRSAR